MDTEELRTFVEVAAAGGVTAGARKLGISKSIVSRRLARLEEFLGLQLFARTTRGLVLTKAGTIFRPSAERVCAELGAAKETLLPTSDLRGRLCIAAPLTFGPTHLSAIISELAQSHPNLHIQTCYTDRIVDIVAEGFDCAIRLGHLEDSSLIAKRIGEFSSTLVTSPAYLADRGSPKNPAELLDHEALMHGTEDWYFMDGNKVVAVNPRGRFKADNSMALVDAALGGLGIAHLPDGLVTKHVASGALVPIMKHYPLKPSGIFIVRPPSRYPARKVRTLTDLISSRFSPSDTHSETSAGIL